VEYFRIEIGQVRHHKYENGFYDTHVIGESGHQAREKAPDDA